MIMADMTNMEKVNLILNNTLFGDTLDSINFLERDRIFCRHGIEHLLDVARIMTIKNLEDDLGFDREIIYSAALLHDIGRACEYENGTSHSVAGAESARGILSQCGFENDEINMIVYAISQHNTACETAEIRDDFARLLKECDKLSRNCFCCNAKDKCKWDSGKMNTKIKI